MSDFWNQISKRAYNGMNPPPDLDDDGNEIEYEGPDDDDWIQNSLEWSSRQPRPQTLQEMMVEDLRMGSKIASEENACRNCDKPCSGEYCSATCEDSDRFPAAQDDQEKFTKGSSRKTASSDLESVARAFARYWGGEFTGIDRGPVSIIDGPWDGPWATVKNEYGEWAKIKDISGEDSGQIENHRENPNYEFDPEHMYGPYKNGEPPYIFDKVMRPAGTYAVLYYDHEVMHINTKGGQLVLEGYNGDITLTGSRKTAESDYDNSWQTDFDANRAYWSGQARAAEEQKAAERRLWDMKGQEVTVIKGRKIPIGTKGIVFYSGEGQWGWRIGFKTESGEEMWTALQNVELTSELSSTTSSRRTSEGRRRCQFCNKSIAFGGMQWEDTTTGTDCPNSNVGHSPSPREDIVAPPQQMLTPESYWGNGAAYVTGTRKTAGPMGINVGDIFYSSWGYDQTNTDYYEIVRVTESMVEVKPIQASIDYSASGRGSDNVKPIPGSYRDFDVRLETGRASEYGKPERQTKMCKVTGGYQGEPTIILNSRANAYAYPYKGGGQHQTPYNMGH